MKIFKKKKEENMNIKENKTKNSKIESFWLNRDQIEKINNYCKENNISRGDFYRDSINKNLRKIS